MTGRKPKRHLEFESLEAMELLSGAGLAGAHAMIHHHAAQVHRAPKRSVGDVALNLAGTLNGTYRSRGAGPGPLHGSGTVSPIGKAQVKGSIALGVGIDRRGRVRVRLQAGEGRSSPPSSDRRPGGGYVYQITGGTRSFAGDTGAASPSSRSFPPTRPIRAAASR